MYVVGKYKIYHCLNFLFITRVQNELKFESSFIMTKSMNYVAGFNFFWTKICKFG